MRKMELMSVLWPVLLGVGVLALLTGLLLLRRAPAEPRSFGVFIIGLGTVVAAMAGALYHDTAGRYRFLMLAGCTAIAIGARRLVVRHRPH